MMQTLPLRCSNFVWARVKKILYWKYFFDPHSIVYHEFIQTVNKEMYVDIHCYLKEAVRRKQLEKYGKMGSSAQQCNTLVLQYINQAIT